MERSLKTREASTQPNFIGDFEPTVLTEVDDANRMSQRKNEYSVFSTKEGKVGIMSGELEHLHEKQGGVLVEAAKGELLPQGKVKPDQDVKISDKILIGRGADGRLFAQAA